MSELSTQLFSPENLIDPYPAYKKLRDEAPVHFMSEMNLHVVTRYDLLREAIKRTDDFSSKYDQFLGGAQQMMFMTLSEEQQAELQSFDENLRHYADQKITLDLDDGVKVNYGRFGELLAEVKAIHGKKVVTV